jgi:hypothetical protein
MSNGPNNFEALRQPATWWSLGLFVALCVLFTVADPAWLREPVMGVLLVLALISVGFGLVKAAPPRPAGSWELIIVLMSGLLLGLLYWSRASVGATTIEKHLTLQIVGTLLFWLPAVCFAALYRHGPEGMAPHGRGRFLLRLLVAAIGAFAARIVVL